MFDLRLLFVAVAWGVNFSLIKSALADFHPLSFTIARFLSAGAFLLGLARMTRGFVPISRADRFALVRLGFIGITLYNILFMYGLQYTTASNSALFVALSPLFAALIQSVTGKERLTAQTCAGLGLAACGAILIIRGSGDGFAFSSAGFLGDVMTLAAAVLWALYTIAAKPLLDKYPPVQVTAWAMISGSILLLPIGFHDLLRQNWSAVPAGSWLAFLFASLIAGGISHSLWYDGVKRIGVTRTVVYHYLMPFVAVLFAALFLSERITTYAVVGGASILAGVALVQKSGSDRTR